MVKKCIVSYDESNNPIGLIDLKEFTDAKSYKDFQELCKKNKELFLKRAAEKEEALKQKEEALYKRIEILEKKCEAAMSGIAHLLGVEDVKDIEKIFENYFRAARGENINEEES